MSGTVSPDLDAGQGTEPFLVAASSRARQRRVAAGAAVLVVLGTAAGGAWHAGAFRSGGQSGTGQLLPPPAATATVTRESLSSQIPEEATLGYAGSYTVRGQGSGTLTWLPSPGQVIRQGQALYRVDNGVPVVLMYGPVPAWRDLSIGVTGADVSQLNRDLVALGYASRADIEALGWDFYSWDTAYAVKQLENRLAVAYPTGSLLLGSVVFEPEAIRVTAVPGVLGTSDSGLVMSGTSTRHVVQISLDTAQEPQVRVGEPVSVALPDGISTPGIIVTVGTVATASGNVPGQGNGPGSGGGSGSGAPAATISVTVRLTRPSDAGNLDQAPVTVEITTSTARDALVVPVGALLAQPSGGYAVEVTGPGNSRRLVAVQLGIFDDTDGLVQVTGALAPGQHVVVPAT